jgi:hypothetical protein
MWYWFIVSLAAWGLFSLIGVYWHHLQAHSPQTILLAMAFGCVANWLQNHTLHCGITGPILLIAGVMSLLSEMDVIHTSSALLWSLTLIGVGMAFLVEWRYASRCKRGWN